MATIGLDKVYYATITEDSNGNETYGTPTRLAKAISAELSVELAEATLYADDGASEIVKEFKSGTLSLNVDDLSPTVVQVLTGCRIDGNNVMVSQSENVGSPVAIGFRAQKSNGKYRYFWLYRVKFGFPSDSMATKGDSVTFNTPTIEGTVTRRNKEDSSGKHPWKADVVEGTTGVPSSVITGWYNTVYEPSFADATLASITINGVTLSPTFNSAVTSYTATTSGTSATVTATATDADDATVTIRANGTTISAGDSVTWLTGANSITIDVVNGVSVKNYMVNVTKS